MESQLREGLRVLSENMHRWFVDPSPVWGNPSGFRELDLMTGGFQKKSFGVIGGRTHHGKTAMITQMAIFLAEYYFKNGIKGKSILFTPEMAVDQVLLRTACIMAEVPTHRIQSGIATEDEIQAVETAKALLTAMEDNLFIWGGASLDITTVKHFLERMAMSNDPIAGVYIDYLTYMTAGSVTEPRAAASYIARQLAEMAVELDIPIIAGAQLNREVEKRGFSKNEEEKYPQLSDIAESGQIEREASFIGLIHNPPDLSKNMQGMPQPALLLVRKNRSTGRLGNVGLVFDNHLGRFVGEDEWKARDVPL